MATAAELQSAIDALKVAVDHVAAEVADLKSAPAPTPVIDQAQLDATTQAVTDATTRLNAL